MQSRGTVGRHELQLHSQGPRRVLDTFHDVRHRVFAVRMGMPECSHANEPGNDISEQLQTLGDQFQAEKGRPSNITARPRQACDQFVAHRVGHDPCDDRDGVRRLLGCAGCRRAPSDKNIDLQPDHFSRQRGEPIRFLIPVSLLYGQVLSYDVTEFV